MPRLEAALRANGVELEKVLLTHGHLDHAGVAATAARKKIMADYADWIAVHPKKEKKKSKGRAK